MQRSLRATTKTCCVFFFARPNARCPIWHPPGAGRGPGQVNQLTLVLGLNPRAEHGPNAWGLGAGSAGSCSWWLVAMRTPSECECWFNEKAVGASLA